MFWSFTPRGNRSSLRSNNFTRELVMGHSYVNGESTTRHCKHSKQRTFSFSIRVGFSIRVEKPGDILQHETQNCPFLERYKLPSSRPLHKL